MFEKLLKNLPFNPSLINQVSFYAKRLRQETSVRRLGFLFMALTFAVQLFAVMSPAQPSVQADTNDVIRGGVTSKAQLVNICRTDPNVRAIYNAFQITCDNIASAGTTGGQQLYDRAYNGQLYSAGRDPYTWLTGNDPISIPGVGTIYAHFLWSWDKPGTTSTYPVFGGHRNDGTSFWIITYCGNPVIVGQPYIPPPPVTPPPPTPKKAMFCSALSMNVSDGSHVKLHSDIILHGQASGNHLPSGQLADFYYTYTTSAKVPKPTTLFSRVNFKTSSTVTDTANHKYTLTAPGHYVFTLTVKYDNGKVASGSAVGKCTKNVYVDNEVCKNPNDHNSCVIKNKRAANITENINDANNTTAKAGDTIEYTLSATNTEKYTTNSKYVIRDYIGDILYYADTVELNGGKVDSQKNISWPAQDIKPGQTISRKFTVKVKDPIPATPVGQSNPTSFDLTMTNSYGDTVTIHLPPPTSKIIESTATTLPNTGPGANIFIAVMLTSVVGYFFARSRLMAKELEIVKVEYSSGA